ncbi:MAG: type VI secretion system lipoprotein TssJ [Bacteroidota bacterium]
MTLLRSALVVVLALTASGCGLFGGAAPPAPVEPELPPGPVAFDLVGDSQMNAGGNSARVYLYPLSSEATFLATPVQAFWDDPETVLADDLAGTVRDATVRPGSTSNLEEVTLEGAPFLGIAADLRTPQDDQWRTVLPASQVRGRSILVTVTEGGLRVTSR